MNAFDDKDSGSILFSACDELDHVKYRAIEIGGLGWAIQNVKELYESAETMAGMGKGIQLLCEDLQEMADQVIAAITEVRMRCSPLGSRHDDNLANRQGDVR